LRAGGVSDQSTTQHQSNSPESNLETLPINISNTATIMPRQGDGSSDNAIEAGHNIIHGAGQEQVRPASHMH